MEATLRLLNIVRMVMLASVFVYAVMAERTSHAAGPVADTFFLGIAAVAFSMLAVCVALKRLVIAPQEDVLRTQPENAAALQRWRGGYIALLAVSESVALYGFVLRFMGAPLARVVPFYAAAICLMLFFGPRRP